MRALMFVLVLTTATVSQAATPVLYCDGGNQAFTANLTAASDYFDLQNAQITGAFTHTNFICAGNKEMTGVKCAGFWNDKSNQHLELSFAKSGDQLVMSYKAISGNRQTAQPWICTVE